MDNNKKLAQAFVNSIDISESQVKDDLSYQSIPEWDSMGHMNLVAQIEELFDIMLDTTEILDMSSVSVIKEIISKHGVSF